MKDIVEEEGDLSVRAGVLIERLKSYEPELPKDMEPMVYVNYCEESEFMNPRCQKLSDLDSRTAEQDKAWYADRNSKTNEPTTTAQMFFTVYYAEKGDQMLQHFKGKIDIGTGNGGLLSQLKLQNEMRLTDESWINYQKGKGNEEFQKYMEDLTDMQNHVLPYLQSFCSLEEKGVQERREQQVTDKKESRVTAVNGVEKQANVKETGKAMYGIEKNSNNVLQADYSDTPKMQKDVEVEKVGIYDIWNDLEVILREGPRFGYHVFTYFRTYDEFKQTKYHLELFKHKITFQCSQDDSRDIMSKSTAFNLGEIAFLYTDMKTIFSMRPYLHEGLQWDGWETDDFGHARRMLSDGGE